MKKKKPKLHFPHVAFEKVEKLLEKKSAGLAGDSETSVERPTPKAEPYSIPLVVNRKKSR